MPVWTGNKGNGLNTDSTKLKSRFHTLGKTLAHERLIVVVNKTDIFTYLSSCVLMSSSNS